MKILTPFLALVITIPLLTILIFNIAMHIYVINNVKAELENTSQTIQALLKKELGTAITDFKGEKVQNIMNTIRTATLASRISLHTEMLIYYGDGELLYPRSVEDSFITKNVSDELAKALNTSARGIVHTIKVDKNEYIYTYQRLQRADIPRNPYVVFIAPINSSDYLITTINYMLIVIMLLGTIISILVSTILSNRISKKINELCLAAKAIGKGEVYNDFEITDMKEIADLSASIREMAEKISAFDKAQRAFLQNASHEIRTPLMSIQGYAEGIGSGIMTDAKKAAGIISKESKKLNELVNELLTLSRIENQTYTKDLVKTILNNSLKEYVQQLEGVTVKTQKQIQLVLSEMDVLVFADDILLSQVVINIAANCIRYAKSKVTIELTQEDKTALIKISDDGDGIAETDLPYIFDRFFKGEAGNFGLGLAIAKSAVEFMGGSITAYNQNGAVFEIRLSSF